MFGDALLLPGFGFRAPLFDERTLKRFLDERGNAGLGDLADRVQAWIEDLRLARLGNEPTLEQAFNQRVMCEALGYIMYPGEGATLWVKPEAAVTHLAAVPDVGLGLNFNVAPQITAVMELKRPGTDLDRPQQRKNRFTPVEQGFDYGMRILTCRWVVVTNMRLIRLYSVDSQTAYLPIDLTNCRMIDGRPTDDLRRLALFHFDQLVQGGEQSAAATLLVSTTAHKKKIEDTFYSLYSDVRRDLLAAVGLACREQGIDATNTDVLQATQRLLDRMLFLAYCEDHPQHLIPPGTVQQVCEGARRRPGPSTHKVYDDLKSLFREVDTGSTEASGLFLAAYNGELFKHDRIIDVIDLPDALYDKPYIAEGGGYKRRIQGVWGFSGFNFWQELDEHLLGSLFERSLSDATGPQRAQRKRHGVFYTDDIAATYLVQGVISKLFNDLPAIPEKDDPTPVLQQRLDVLSVLQVLDPTCGSGAFLVAAYRALLGEWTRLRELISLVRVSRSAMPSFDFDTMLAVDTQAKLLRETLFGADLLPQAVELAKLALWLRSARKGERVANLGHNVVVCDSLRLEDLLRKTERDAGSFDAVVGNPPWGGEINPDTRVAIMRRLSIDPPSPLDSWELFLLLGLHLLKADGRLAFVLPDTLFAPEKEWIRRYVLERTSLERIVNLGMDWFGESVRMGAVAFQSRLCRPLEGSTFTGFSLVGKLRRDAIRGRVLLTQVEAERGKRVSQSTALSRAGAMILVTQDIRDDEIMGTMVHHSNTFSSLTKGLRGEELSGHGTLWRCMGCGYHDVPPDERRNATEKLCLNCNAKLDQTSVDVVRAVVPREVPTRESTFLLVDTEDIHRRYGQVTPSKKMLNGLLGWEYKPADKFLGPKILAREAGVGLTVGYDESDAKCVRSMYAYHLNERAASAGYSLKYVIAALQSRTMHYYTVKITNQGDPRRPFANIRMRTIETLPIPRVAF